jgi:hypothetical protein
MPQIIEIAIPPDQIDRLIEALDSREDVLGLRS